MYSSIMDVLPYPTILVNNIGEVVKLNEVAQNYVRQNRTIGFLIMDMLTRQINHKERTRIISPISKTLKTGKEFMAENITIINKNKPINLIVNTVLLKDNLGNIDGACASFFKIPSQNNIREQFEILSCLAKAIESKCEYTKSHSSRVALLSMYIGRVIGLDKRQLKLLFLAALLHDIGKIGISERILHKNGPLTEKEFQIIRKHSLIGANILNSMDSLSELVPVVLHHHERFDGNGYPAGLAGENIPLLSRIITVADAFEAMTSDRCYRKKVSFDTAFEELKKNSGTQFDPEIANVFTKSIGKQSVF